ncbi:hypothetical protein F4811DRAFT_559330 [Daldinia bambusicola]|nr:hypothetical protein F4811DRAFT_559330 [Daldinia bambusicola]
MQRVSALLPWDRNRASSPVIGSNNGHNKTVVRKNSVDLVRGWADRIPSPVNRHSTSRLSTHVFHPATLDKECDKAARILKSFCSDGFSTPDDRPGTPSTYSSTQSSHKFLKKIPPRILQNAVGLAIFTSMRSGIWSAGSGSGGSGILIARKTDGTWSPPSGLMLHTASLRFIFGVDIYDCVLVINNFTVLEAFARPRLTLGTDVSLTTGPLVAVGLLENDVTWADLSDRAIAYVKARGQSAEVKLDGIVITERADENERYYGMKISVAKILAGDINQSLPQMRPLTEVLKAAEGRTDYDTALVELLSSQPVPGDATLESPVSTGTSPGFGVPDFDDPDPFGVMALEMAGMGIREAGTRLRPDSSQFEFNPSPTSPFFAKASRQSMDTYLSRSNRGSYMSNKTMATERSQMTDAGTQTCDFPTPQTTPGSSQSQSEDGNQPQTSEDAPVVKQPVEVDYTKIDISALRSLSNFPDLDDEPTTTTLAIKEEDEDDSEAEVSKDVKSTATRTQNNGDAADKVSDKNHENDTDKEDEDEEEAEEEDEEEDDEDDESDAEEEAVVFEVATAQAPARVAMVASRVNIPARVPPPLPLRSPARTSKRRSQMGDVNGLMGSPLKQEFEAEGEGEEATTPRAKEDPAKHLAVLDDALVTKVASNSQETKQNIEKAENAITPTEESGDINSHSTKIGNRSSYEAKAMTETSTDTKEHSGLKTTPDVSVSVA